MGTMISMRSTSLISYCRLIILAWCTLWVAACTQPPVEVTDQANVNDIRIVSFSPALTRIAVDLGLGDYVVGRTPWCEAVDKSVPVAGDLLNLDLETLVRLKPTHILIQPPSSGIDPTLTSLADERGWKIASWKIDTIEDIKRVVREIPGYLNAEDDVLLDRAKALESRIQIATFKQIAGDTNYKVLIATPYDPPLVYGIGTYLHDLIINMGFANAVAVSGWADLTLEDITRIDPDIIIIVSSTVDSSQPLVAAGPLGRLDVTAVREGRVGVLSHPEANLPSSAVVEVAEELRQILEKTGGKEG